MVSSLLINEARDSMFEHDLVGSSALGFGCFLSILVGLQGKWHQFFLSY